MNDVEQIIPFRFETQPSGDVVRIRNSDGKLQVIFRAATQSQAAAWLDVYLMLSIDDRHRLIDACSGARP